ncbi:MAG: cytochrome C oxidase subunit IV family protein [Paludibacter sp.]|nr:cytochrome C oxidase subunit IV family protein [Paludibacter sp.]
MRHSILSVILTGILVGALFFFMPKLVLGIFIFMVIIHLLHFGHMRRGWYGHGYYGHHGYRNGCYCGPGCGPEDECCDSDYGHDHHKHHGDHHHGHHDHMHGQLFYWADKIRSMSDEEFTEFKNNMNTGFGRGRWGKDSESYDRCRCGKKSAADCDCDTTDKKEDTTQNNESK